MSRVAGNGTAPAVVVGGGVAGLAAARLVARHFARVVVLERDVRDDVASGDEAFRVWGRDGVPQFRHSHAFLARLRLTLLGHLPDVLDRLRAAGVREITLPETVPPAMRLRPRPDDDDVVLLACRRATFEWALRESVRSVPNVELREGVRVAGLVGTAANGSRPAVAGVRLADGAILPAALVVDATGRRSRAPEWLAALGAPPVRERSADTGIFYFTRFYRLRRGRPPRGVTGLVAGDLGWVKLAVFPGDAGTFSITVGAPVEDETLKTLSDPAVFERFLAAFPAMAPWRRRGVADPADGPRTPVLVMGELKNRLRRFVDDGGPLAPGLVVIGDGAYHTNPVYGRGCPMALVQAALLDEALGRHGSDLVAVARHLHRESEAELRPFWEAAVAADRRAMGARTFDVTSPVAALVQMAETAFGWFFERGILPATRVDPVVFRGLLRVFHMLEPPEHLVRNPELVLRSLPVLARVLRGGGPVQLFAHVPRAAVMAKLGGLRA
jgi:2-polyprenyl-6-methoxyphenol hydroxylase-like FAD-dependent oxidoreductase